MHQFGVLLDVGVLFADGHARHHATQVRQPALQHRLLQEPVHSVALDRNGARVFRHPHIY